MSDDRNCKGHLFDDLTQRDVFRIADSASDDLENEVGIIKKKFFIS
jgi:hypothetical protein